VYQSLVLVYLHFVDERAFARMSDSPSQFLTIGCAAAFALSENAKHANGNKQIKLCMLDMSKHMSTGYLALIICQVDMSSTSGQGVARVGVNNMDRCAPHGLMMTLLRVGLLTPNAGTVLSTRCLPRR
jgi:hypothetical protein